MSRPHWEYRENGNFYSFDETTSNHIEDQYLRQPYATIKLPIFGVVYDINFSQMIRVDTRRQVQEQIRRVLPDNSVPSLLNATSSKAVYVWHYNDNGYRKLDPTTNGKFERTFAKNPNAKFIIQILQHRFIVDFSAMLLTHTETQSEHQLLRLDVTQNKGFVIPKAVEKAQRNIVAGKVREGFRAQLPAERQIIALMKDLPTLPNFSAYSLKTPSLDIIKPSNNLPLLPPGEYEHKSTCAICFCEILHPKTEENLASFEDVEDYNPEYHSKVTCLPCGHIYHHSCAQSAIESSPRCPSCRQSVGATFGQQPEGTMTVTWSNTGVSGFSSKWGCINISFDMIGGVQTARQPHPGVSYAGDSRSCYLPGSANGFRALRWLALSWMHFSTFAVGYSGTRNCDDVVIYAIHLKTALSGGESGHGWPDKTYFKRFHTEVKECGIQLEEYDPKYDDSDPATCPSVMNYNKGLEALELETL